MIVSILIFLFFLSACSPTSGVNTPTDSQLETSQPEINSDNQGSVSFPDEILAKIGQPVCQDFSGQVICAMSASDALNVTETEENMPVAIPVIPEQSLVLLSSMGGSPAGVSGFTALLLGGPGTYQIVAKASFTTSIGEIETDIQSCTYHHKGLRCKFPGFCVIMSVLTSQSTVS